MTVKVYQLRHYERRVEVIIQKRENSAVLEVIVQMTVEVHLFQC